MLKCLVLPNVTKQVKLLSYLDIILLVTWVFNRRHSDANGYCLLSLNLLQSTNIDVISLSDADSRDQQNDV